MRFMGKSITDELGKVLDAAVERGWLYCGLTSRGHFKLRHPASNIIQVVGPSRDPHAAQNVRAQLARVERELGPPEPPKTKIAAEFSKFAPVLQAPIQAPIAPSQEIDVNADANSTEAKMDLPTEAEMDLAIASLRDLGKRENNHRLAMVLRAVGYEATKSSEILGFSRGWYAQVVKPRICAERYAIPFFTDVDTLLLSEASGRAPNLSPAAAHFASHWATKIVSERIVSERTQSSVVKTREEERPTASDDEFDAFKRISEAKKQFDAAVAALKSARDYATESGYEVRIVAESWDGVRVIVKTISEI